MKRQPLTLFLLAFFFCVAGTRDAKALRPVYGADSLVAGDGGSGFKDGPFQEALFRDPYGLAVDEKGTRIFVADWGNHRIRVVHLDQNNLVSTLSGTGAQGRVDGPATLAQFNGPKLLAYLGKNQLAVYDSVDAFLRRVDIETGAVTTLAGNGQSGVTEGDALQVPMDNLWAMAFLSGENSIYFSQPSQGALRKLDLGTNKVTTVFLNDARVPHPAALCVLDQKLYVADQSLTQVYQVQPKAGSSPDLVYIGNGIGVLALAGSGKYLYAVQNNPEAPLQRFLTEPGPVSFVSVWGDFISMPGNSLPFFAPLNGSSPVGFLPDPNHERRFYLSNPDANILTSISDLFQAGLANTEQLNSNGITDFDYPEQKPSGVFRILLLGDSHVFHTFDFAQRGWTYTHRQITMAKRLELMLNTQAALEDVPLNFEVLSQARISWDPLFLWPYYATPPIAQKYDVDLVLLMMSPGDFESFYFQRPFGPEGIPLDKDDPEYLLKPYQDRIPPGVPKQFFDICLSKKWVTISKSSQLDFASYSSMTEDPQADDDMAEMVGKPISLLNKKLSGLRTSGGKPVRFQLFFMPTGHFQSTVIYRDLWKKASQKYNFPFLDLSDDMNALRPTYYPFSELGGNDHLAANGHEFMASLIYSFLTTENLIPWKTSGAVNPAQSPKSTKPQ